MRLNYLLKQKPNVIFGIMKEKALFNWSGGKDSALCLYKLMQTQQYDIVALLTSVNQQHQRISMHGVRTELLDKQAESIGLPSVKMLMPENSSMNDYENIMRSALQKFTDQHVTVSIFGDIFLEDLRAYREEKLKEVNMKGIFPLWKIPTKDLIREFIGLGFKTITTCVNEKYLDKSFVGRIIDHDFINDLPDNVDPCGENGEFHTFVFDGPIFKNPIAFEKGEIVYKKYESPKNDNNDVCNTTDENPYEFGFWYCDLI